MNIVGELLTSETMCVSVLLVCIAEMGARFRIPAMKIDTPDNCINVGTCYAFAGLPWTSSIIFGVILAILPQTWYKFVLSFVNPGRIIRGLL